MSSVQMAWPSCAWRAELFGLLLTHASHRAIQAQPGIPPLAVRQMYKVQPDGSIGALAQTVQPTLAC